MTKEALNDEDLETLTDAGQALITAILNRQSSSDIQALIKDGAPLWYQDEDGVSALHAAAYIEDSELVQQLIQKGAVWNAVDNLHNTAGDVALSLNNETCYRIIRDAGIRSGEFLINIVDDMRLKKHHRTAFDSTLFKITSSFDYFLEGRR